MGYSPPREAFAVLAGFACSPAFTGRANDSGNGRFRLMAGFTLGRISGDFATLTAINDFFGA
jgi:hypothetical protein